MKNLKLKSMVIILLSAIALCFGFAKSPTYNLSLQNLKLTAPNVLEFDIYLIHTNPDETNFKYILGQYFFNFNPEIANGGKLTYSIVSSDLAASLQPRNPSVSGNELRLAGNSIPSKERLPVISDVFPGTLIARMKLETSANTFSQQSVNLEFRTGPENPYTKIFSYSDNKIVDITNPQGAISDFVSEGILPQNNTELPKEYSLSQNYPNPFNPTTNIKFDIPKLANVKLSVYDITGREIATLVNNELEPGRYEYKFDGSNYASGIYFFRIKAGDFFQVRKMFLIK
jgi:Secretion system C-terminal sorting domain